VFSLLVSIGKFNLHFFQQHHEKGQLLEAGQEIFSNHNAIHHLHETFTKQVEKEYL
jgi:hypothetical protein